MERIKEVWLIMFDEEKCVLSKAGNVSKVLLTCAVVRCCEREKSVSQRYEHQEGMTRYRYGD